MVARSRARYLAPIALAAAITATYLVVHAQVSDKHSAPRAHVIHRRRRGARRFATARTYVVQSGDSLSSISSKTGVPVPTLESLNPGVDTNDLQIGQRLRLRQ
jgi:hypothetical protein